MPAVIVIFYHVYVEFFYDLIVPLHTRLRYRTLRCIVIFTLLRILSLPAVALLPRVALSLRCRCHVATLPVRSPFVRCHVGALPRCVAVIPAVAVAVADRCRFPVAVAIYHRYRCTLVVAALVVPPLPRLRCYVTLVRLPLLRGSLQLRWLLLRCAVVTLRCRCRYIYVAVLPCVHRTARVLRCHVLRIYLRLPHRDFVALRIYLYLALLDCPLLRLRCYTLLPGFVGLR